MLWKVVTIQYDFYSWHTLFDIICCSWMLLIDIDWLMVDTCMTLPSLYVCILWVVLFYYGHCVYDWCILIDVYWFCILIFVFWLMYSNWCMLIDVLWSLSFAWWICVDVFWLCILIDVFWLMYSNWCMLFYVLWLMCFDWCTMIDACMVSWCMYGCPWLIVHDRYMINIGWDIMNWWSMSFWMMYAWGSLYDWY